LLVSLGQLPNDFVDNLHREIGSGIEPMHEDGFWNLKVVKRWISCMQAVRENEATMTSPAAGQTAAHNSPCA